MSLLHAGERKVPEIMVHEVQEAFARQLDVLGSYTVRPEPTDLACKELIHGRIALDIELGEPPAIHGLI
jgi:hypothetical protein